MRKPIDELKTSTKYLLNKGLNLIMEIIPKNYFQISNKSNYMEHIFASRGAVTGRGVGSTYDLQFV